MRLLYSIAIRLYGLGIKLASPVNLKARQWVSGRKNWPDQIGSIPKSKQIVWIHCASTGEYEQGKPVIKAIKDNYSNIYIVLTFFSPSGYHAFTPSPLVDKILYLPLDTRYNAHAFISRINPSFAVFIKYEIWYHYLNELEINNIPAYLVSARFYKDHYMFKSGFSFIRNRLKNMKMIFVQDETSQKLLEKNGFGNVMVAGDTRLEQVVQNREHPFMISWLDDLVRNRTCLVAGSTWPKDDQLLVELQKLLPEILLIVAPHEYTDTKIQQLKMSFGPACYTYSELELQNPQIVNTVLMDSMGMLKYLYRYADLAYIGGGFDQGIHNILEAVVYDIPVFFGPNHDGFIEASDLIGLKIAKVITKAEQLRDQISSIDEHGMARIANVMQSYIGKNSGTVRKIMTQLAATSPDLK